MFRQPEYFALCAVLYLGTELQDGQSLCHRQLCEMVRVSDACSMFDPLHFTTLRYVLGQAWLVFVQCRAQTTPDNTGRTEAVAENTRHLSLAAPR